MASFDPKSVGLAVITYYPRWYSGKLLSVKHTDKVRGDLALEFAKKAVAVGYQTIFVDGKSAKTFRKELETISDLKVIRRKSLGSASSKRQAIKSLAKNPEVKVIVLTEAEKVSLVTDCLEAIVIPILHGDADVVVPKRENRLFKSSYPGYMYESETEGNQIYNEALRTHGILPAHHEDFDMFFGPRAFRNSKHLINIFTRRYRLIGESFLSKLYDPEAYSNILFFPIVSALKRKINVIRVEVPFVYPKIQKENEEMGAKQEFILKRNLQRVSLLIDLMHFLSYLQRKKNTRLRYVE